MHGCKHKEYNNDIYSHTSQRYKFLNFYSDDAAAAAADE